MKKVFMMAVMVLVAMATSASTKYVVWSGDELTADEEQLPVDWYGWWNMTYEQVDDADAPEGRAVTYRSADGSGACSMGIYIGDNGNRFDMSLLAQCDLVFYAKVSGAGNWTVRLTGKDSGDVDSKLTIPADGLYHEVRWNIAEVYPKIYETWSKASSDEAFYQGYVFSAIGDGVNAESLLSVCDIHYEASLPMPEITANVEGVTQTEATLVYTVAFPEGYTNTSVTINGKTATASPVTLSGLTPSTEYVYTIVAAGTYGGKVFTREKTVTFKTLRDMSNTPVWYDSIDGVCTQYGNEYKVHVDYNIAYNADNTLTVYAEFSGLDGIVGLAPYQISFVRGLIEEWKFMDRDGDVYIYTTTATADESTEIEFFFWAPYAEGVFGGDYHRIYVAGSQNEAPKAAPRVRAEVQNLTYNSAEIAYTVDVPAFLEDSVIKVYVNGNEATTNPMVLSGLTEHTEYEISVYAEATFMDETYTSLETVVRFRTPYQNATEKMFHDYVKAEFKNAYLEGEDASMARTFYWSLPFSLTHGLDGHLRYEIDLTQCANVVGLVPQIYWNGFKNLVRGEGNVWSYDFGEQDDDSNITISHYLAYAGGAVDVNFGSLYHNVGQEQEIPTIGDIAVLELKSSKTLVGVGQSFILTVMAKDEAGYYVDANDIEISVPAGAVYTDGICRIGNKGEYVFEVVSGDFRSSVSVIAGYSEGSGSLIGANEEFMALTDEDSLMENSVVENAFDSNVASELRWSCADTEEHYLMVDLGDLYYVECVRILFEGAYATDFDLVFTNNPGGSIMPLGAAEDASTEDVAYEVTGGGKTEHVFVNEPAGSHRFIMLNTHKALNAGWGIKIKEFEVYGSADRNVTGCENVLDENMPAEYYTLGGLRVVRAGLAPGLYVKRQGAKSVKVLVK